MISCTRKISFDAAHRIMNHESKCHNLHGHRYIAEASFSAKELDELGRVIDFSVIKEKLKGWIDANWDHNTILHKDDKELGESIAKILNQQVYYLPYNASAENMAKYLLEEVCPNLFADEDVKCVKIRLHETENCYAEVVKS